MVSIAEHIGVNTILNAPRDIHLILIARCTRLAAFGAISLILVQFLKSKGINETEIGILLTFTLVGDLIFSFLLALVSDSLGRRKILLLSSLLITLTGALLYYFENIFIISIVMIFGVVTTSGGEVGPFRSIEQSAISSLTRYEDRSDIFSWYTFTGGFSAGLGSLVIGFLIGKDNYEVCFLFYTINGMILFILNFLLSSEIEIENDITVKASERLTPESETLLGGDGEEIEEPVTPNEKKSLIWKLVPKFSPESLKKLLLLTVLICLDSLGMSLSTKAWTAYYFKIRYALSSSSLGLIFGTAAISGALMALVGTYFCKKYGPIRTMVTVHTTASVMLVMMALPIGMREMVTLFLTRSLIRTMDLPSKHVFISATVEPQERTAAIGFINASKTLVNTFGPLISGVLASKDEMWLCFLVAGILRLSYDVGLYINFWDFKDNE